MGTQRVAGNGLGAMKGAATEGRRALQSTYPTPTRKLYRVNFEIDRASPGLVVVDAVKLGWASARSFGVT